MEPPTLHPGWDDLLTWLKSRGFDSNACRVECRASPGAGYGLFAVQDAEPSALLLTIPPRAMMNIRTLLPLYRPQGKDKPLTASQTITLHICLYRPKDGEASRDTDFGPHISALPTEFNGHPLTWRVRMDVLSEHLLSRLPPRARKLTEKMHERYVADFLKCQKHMGRRGHDPLLPEDFLWAWLNVNTRCFYHRLKRDRAHADNLTLIPLMDYANHRPSPHATPAATNADIFDASPVGLGEPFSLLAPCKSPIRAAEEIFFQYGRHSNTALFVEYGFVNEFRADEITSGDFEADVDVQDLMEALFASRGNIGSWMRSVLEQERYWGDWTLHASPEPRPSFRVMIALRLYHLVPENADHSTLLADEAEILGPWRSVVLGQAFQISDANEAMWRLTIIELCEKLRSRGITALDLVGPGDETSSWKAYALHSIRKLWEEEIEVALVVERSIEDGNEF